MHCKKLIVSTAFSYHYSVFSYILSNSWKCAVWRCNNKLNPAKCHLVFKLDDMPSVLFDLILSTCIVFLLKAPRGQREKKTR